MKFLFALRFLSQVVVVRLPSGVTPVYSTIGTVWKTHWYKYTHNLIWSLYYQSRWWSVFEGKICIVLFPRNFDLKYTSIVIVKEIQIIRKMPWFIIIKTLSVQPGATADPRVPGRADPDHHGQSQRPGEECQGVRLPCQLILARRGRVAPGQECQHAFGH